MEVQVCEHSRAIRSTRKFNVPQRRRWGQKKNQINRDENYVRPAAEKKNPPLSEQWSVARTCTHT